MMHDLPSAASSSPTSPAASHPDLPASYAVYGNAAESTPVALGSPPGVLRRSRFGRSQSPESMASSMPYEKARKGPIVITSTLLKEPVPKPWLTEPARFSWLPRYLFLFVSSLGIVAAAAQIYLGLKSVPKLGNICLVLDEQFDGPGLDTSIWTREVGVDGFGNGEFEWATSSDNNSRVEDGVLYIVPTLTEDVIGRDAVFDGYNLTLSDCTTGNASACWVYSNSTAGTVINPVQSARLTTRLSKSVKYARLTYFCAFLTLASDMVALKCARACPVVTGYVAVAVVDKERDLPTRALLCFSYGLRSG